MWALADRTQRDGGVTVTHSDMISVTRPPELVRPERQHDPPRDEGHFFPLIMPSVHWLDTDGGG